MTPETIVEVHRPRLPSGLGSHLRGELEEVAKQGRWLRNPVGWAQKRLHVYFWSKQREIANAVVRNPRTTVRSAHDTGKSFTAANLTAWWLSVHPIGSAFVVTTAPTAPQVEVILWREIARAKNRGNLPGHITSGTIPKWKSAQHGGEIIAYGRKPQDLKSEEAAAQAFQGIHARYVLVILDEACGIPDWLWNAAETIATNRFARVLAIGNPDVPDTQFFKTHQPDSAWKKIAIPASSTPAWTGESVPESLMSDLVSPGWVEARRADWGEESPIFKSKIMAEFPEVSEETLIHPKLIQAAQQLDLSGAAIHEPGRFGLDVARFGRNETVCYRFRAGHLREEFNHKKQDTMRTSGMCVRVLNKTYGHAPMAIDTIGVGGGVFDRLAEQGFPVTSFVASEAPSTPTNRRRFANRRAESWWAFRQMFERGEIDIDPTDLKLAAQIGSIKYFIRSDGRIIVESKDEMEERGLPSPDRGDAAMMACVPHLRKPTDFYIPPKPTSSPWDIAIDSDLPSISVLTQDLLERRW